MKSRHRYHEIIELLLYLIIAFILVYYTPIFFSRIVFLLILPIAWISKRDYLWFAFFLILADTPGGFFSGGARDDVARLPIYSFAAGFSFTITQLYLLVMLLKSIKNKYHKQKLKIYFSNNLKVLAYYFILLITISLLIGMSFNSMREVFKIAVNLTIFYSIFYILSNRNDLTSFLWILFPFVFVALAFQIYGLTFGHQPIELFKPGALRNLYSSSDSPLGWQRPIEMVFTLFICFTGSLFFWGNNDAYFNKLYLVIINIVSFVSIFLTGTRSWTFAFILSYIIFMGITRTRFNTSLPKILLGIVFAFILLKYSTVLDDQMTNAWSRFSTVKNLASGDLSLGETAPRYQKYTPRLWEGFKQSTIVFGAGFSDLYYKYSNIHIGYHNLLFNVGIVGVFLYLSLFIKIIHRIHLSSFQKQLISIKLSIIPLLMLLVINSAVQTIGYGVIHTPFFIIQAFTLALIVIANSVNWSVA